MQQKQFVLHSCSSFCRNHRIYEIVREAESEILKKLMCRKAFCTRDAPTLVSFGWKFEHLAQNVGEKHVQIKHPPLSIFATNIHNIPINILNHHCSASTPLLSISSFSHESFSYESMLNGFKIQTLIKSLFSSVFYLSFLFHSITDLSTKPHNQINQYVLDWTNMIEKEKESLLNSSMHCWGGTELNKKHSHFAFCLIQNLFWWVQWKTIRWISKMEILVNKPYLFWMFLSGLPSHPARPTLCSVTGL